ncbi:hypothetical protein [Oceanobacillus halophilus]|uniref:hypothetical protein n=1 Tax=Oceanobacillus halophilus TaxID=930130 RepID=UPI001314F267|nr:hypothetical protein [Oceanobacillus halophilus]
MHNDIYIYRVMAEERLEEMKKVSYGNKYYKNIDKRSKKSTWMMNLISRYRLRKVGS